MIASFLCPSRGRPESFARSVASLQKSAADPHNFEVLAYLDDDDPTAGQYRHLGPVVFRRGPRVGYARLNEVVNLMALDARGAWLFLWNDDCLMQTPEWDRTIALWPPTFVGNPATNHGSPGLCVFPIVPSVWVRKLGHFALDGANDTWWQKIGEINGTLKPVPISILHDRSDLTGGHDDQTRRENDYNPATFWAAETQALIRADAEKLCEQRTERAG